MRPNSRSTLALAAFSLLSGCLATRGQLRTSVETQQAALATERSERVAADNQLQSATDALRQELGAVKGDVQSLRNDLQSMRTDLGAKISMMEDGMHFLMPVNFAFNDATVRDPDHVVLDRFAKVVQQYYPDTKI